MNKVYKSYARLLSFAAVIVILDQFTKYIVRTNLPLGQVWLAERSFTQYVRIVHWYNTGAAGGLFQGMNTLFAGIAFLAIGIILYFYTRIPSDERVLRLSMGFLLGGASGNLIDRITQGHVTDFFSVGNIPVLNLADLSVAIGLVLFVLGLWQRERKSGNAKRTQKDPPDKSSDDLPNIV